MRLTLHQSIGKEGEGMKVIALMKEGWKSERVYLVEMTGREIATVGFGSEYEYNKVKIGLEIEPTQIFDHTRKILENRHAVENAAKNLRAMAELLDSLRPIVEEAISIPQEGENEK